MMWTVLLFVRYMMFTFGIVYLHWTVVHFGILRTQYVRLYIRSHHIRLFCYSVCDTLHYRPGCYTVVTLRFVLHYCCLFTHTLPHLLLPIRSRIDTLWALTFVRFAFAAAWFQAFIRWTGWFILHVLRCPERCVYYTFHALVPRHTVVDQSTTALFSWLTFPFHYIFPDRLHGLYFVPPPHLQSDRCSPFVTVGLLQYDYTFIYVYRNTVTDWTHALGCCCCCYLIVGFVDWCWLRWRGYLINDVVGLRFDFVPLFVWFVDYICWFYIVHSMTYIIACTVTFVVVV